MCPFPFPSGGGGICRAFVKRCVSAAMEMGNLSLLNFTFSTLYKKERFNFICKLCSYYLNITAITERYPVDSL